MVDMVASLVLDQIGGLARGVYDLADGNLERVPEQRKRLRATTELVVACVSKYPMSYAPPEVRKYGMRLFRQLCRTRYQMDLLGSKKSWWGANLWRTCNPQKVVDDLNALADDLRAAHDAFQQVVDGLDRLGEAKHVQNESARGFWLNFFKNDRAVSLAQFEQAVEKHTRLAPATVGPVVQRAVRDQLVGRVKPDEITVHEFDTWINHLTKLFPTVGGVQQEAVARTPSGKRAPVPPSLPAVASTGSLSSLASPTSPTSPSSPFARADERAADAQKAGGGKFRVILHHATLTVNLREKAIMSKKMSPKAVVAFPDGTRDLTAKADFKYGDTLKKVKADESGHLDPQWDVELEFALAQPLAALAHPPTLTIYLFDDSKEKVIGRMRVDVSAFVTPHAAALPAFTRWDVWTPAGNYTEKLAGSVYVTVEYIPAGVDPTYGAWNPAAGAEAAAFDALLTMYHATAAAPPGGPAVATDAKAAPVTPPAAAKPPAPTPAKSAPVPAPAPTPVPHKPAVDPAAVALTIAATVVASKSGGAAAAGSGGVDVKASGAAAGGAGKPASTPAPADDRVTYIKELYGFIKASYDLHTTLQREKVAIAALEKAKAAHSVTAATAAAATKQAGVSSAMNQIQLNLRNTQWKRLQDNIAKLESRRAVGDYDEVKAKYDAELATLTELFAGFGVAPGTAKLPAAGAAGAAAAPAAAVPFAQTAEGKAKQADVDTYRAERRTKFAAVLAQFEFAELKALAGLVASDAPDAPQKLEIELADLRHKAKASADEERLALSMRRYASADAMQASIGQLKDMAVTAQKLQEEGAKMSVAQGAVAGATAVAESQAAAAASTAAFQKSHAKLDDKLGEMDGKLEMLLAYADTFNSMQALMQQTISTMSVDTATAAAAANAKYGIKTETAATTA